MGVSKIRYSLIMLHLKFHSFLRGFITSFCALFCTRTIIDSSVCCNYKNLINYHVLLVQNTAFGFVQKLCLRGLKHPPRWFENHINDSTLYSPSFSFFFEQIESIIQFHMKPMYDIFSVGKWVAKWPAIRTSMKSQCILYVIRKYIIDTTIKGLDIHWLYLGLIWPGYQVLNVASHQ